jgi:hypothetical protein
MVRNAHRSLLGMAGNSLLENHCWCTSQILNRSAAVVIRNRKALIRKACYANQSRSKI